MKQCQLFKSWMLKGIELSRNLLARILDILQKFLFISYQLFKTWFWSQIKLSAAFFLPSLVRKYGRYLKNCLKWGLLVHSESGFLGLWEHIWLLLRKFHVIWSKTSIENAQYACTGITFKLSWSFYWTHSLVSASKWTFLYWN